MAAQWRLLLTGSSAAVCFSVKAAPWLMLLLFLCKPSFLAYLRSCIVFGRFRSRIRMWLSPEKCEQCGVFGLRLAFRVDPAKHACDGHLYCEQCWSRWRTDTGCDFAFVRHELLPGNARRCCSCGEAAYVESPSFACSPDRHRGETDIHWPGEKCWHGERPMADARALTALGTPSEVICDMATQLCLPKLLREF